MEQQIFKDAKLQAEYEKNGYVIVPFFSEKQLTELLEAYESLPDVNDSGFFASLYTSDEYYKRMAHNLLADAGQKIADKFLNDYQVLIGNYVTKTVGDNSVMPTHQDWTFVDETKFASINIWFPLVDVTHENGAIYLLKGGHKLPLTIRGTLIDSCFNKVTNMSFDTLTYLPMNAGEVLLYNHNLIHTSPPNKSRQIRIAAALSAVPRKAQVIHYFNNPTTQKVEKYAANFDFFMKYTWGMKEMPKGTQLLEIIELQNPTFSNDDVVYYLENPPLNIDKENKKNISILYKIKQLFKWK